MPNKFLNLKGFMESEQNFQFMSALFNRTGTRSVYTDMLVELEAFNASIDELNKGIFATITEAEDKAAENDGFIDYFTRFSEIVVGFNQKINTLASKAVINIENIVDAYEENINDPSIMGPNFTPFSMRLETFKNINDCRLPEFTAKKYFTKDFDSIGKQMQDLGAITTNAAKLGIIVSTYNSLSEEMGSDFLKKCTEQLVGATYDETKSYAEQVYRLFRVGETEREVCKTDVLTAKAALEDYQLYCGIITSTAEKLIADFESISNSVYSMLYQNKASVIKINTDTDGVANKEYPLNAYALNHFNVFMKKKAEQLVQIVNMYAVAFAVKADAIVSFITQCKDVIVQATGNPEAASSSAMPTTDDTDIAPDADVEVGVESEEEPEDNDDSSEDGDEDDFGSDDDEDEDDDYEPGDESDFSEEEPDEDDDDDTDGDGVTEGTSIGTNESYALNEGIIKNYKTNYRRIKMLQQMSPLQSFAESCKKGSYPAYLGLIDKITDIEDVQWLRAENSVAINDCANVIERMKQLSKNPDVKGAYVAITKSLMEQGVKVPHVQNYKKWLETVFVKKLEAKAKKLKAIAAKESFFDPDNFDDDKILEEMCTFFEYESFQIGHIANQIILSEEYDRILREADEASGASGASGSGNGSSGSGNGGQGGDSGAQGSSGQSSSQSTSSTSNSLSNTQKLADNNSTKLVDAWRWLVEKFMQIWNKFKDIFVNKTTARIKQLTDHKNEIDKNNFADNATVLRYDTDKLASLKIPDLNYEAMKADLTDADVFAKKHIFDPSAMQMKEGSGVSGSIKNTIIPSEETKGIDAAFKGKMYDYCVNKMKGIVTEAENQKNIISKASNNASRIAQSLANESAMEYLVEFNKGEGTKSIKKDILVYFKACTAALSTKVSIANKAFNEFYRALRSLFDGKGDDNGDKK